MARPLGENQAYALRCLDERNGGTWYPGAGWVWDNTSTTVRMLDGLTRRGLAVREERKHLRTGEPYPFYRITEKGRETVREMSPGHRSP